MSSILIFCKTLLKGGAEKQALTLSKLLTDKELNLILISWCGNKIDSYNLDFVKNNYIKYIGLAGNPIKKFIQLQRIIKNEGISIILCYLTKANLIAGISKQFNKKIKTIGGIRTEKLPYYKFLIERFLHNHLNDATVFNNYTGKQKFEKKGFNPNKMFVIHNTIHTPALGKSTEAVDGIRLVSVCRFVESKDFRTALYSFKVLVDNNKNIKFKYLIIGYGPLEKRIKSLAEDLSLQNEVEILINPPDIPGILKTCNIYLSTSLYEGLSNSIMEAMVAGMPIIATNVGDNYYLIKDSFNGFIVPCGNTSVIVEKLEFLVNSEDARKRFGINSRKYIEKEFSEEKFMENYFKLFSEIAVSD